MCCIAIATLCSSAVMQHVISYTKKQKQKALAIILAAIIILGQSSYSHQLYSPSKYLDWIVECLASLIGLQNSCLIGKGFEYLHMDITMLLIFNVNLQ